MHQKRSYTSLVISQLADIVTFKVLQEILKRIDAQNNLLDKQSVKFYTEQTKKKKKKLLGDIVMVKNSDESHR